MLVSFFSPFLALLSGGFSVHYHTELPNSLISFSDPTATAGEDQINPFQKLTKRNILWRAA
jgi:hypothetical protein